MNIILITAYAINPYKGSEDGTGWNWVMQIAKHNRVIAITRENNQEAIEKYYSENTNLNLPGIQFKYFDLPAEKRKWKKGSRGSLLYHYLWHKNVVEFIKAKNLNFDIAHHLNFHNDWHPSFLYKLGKPVVWGPIGHHPKIPRNYLIENHGLGEVIKEELKWMVKKACWTFNPELKKASKNTNKVLFMHSEVPKCIKLDSSKSEKFCAVGAKESGIDFPNFTVKENFTVLSIGRFVPLKGFDLTIDSFSKFYYNLTAKNQKKAKLVLVGKGPLKNKLIRQVKVNGLENAVEFIEWMPQEELKNLYKKADVFLFPSHEGAGMVIPEALSYSIPVICLNNFGPGELIDSNSGFSVDYTTNKESCQKMASKLDLLFKDPHLRNSMAKGAIELFNERFLWESKGKRVSQIYSDMMNPKIEKNDRQQAEKSLKPKILATHLLNDFSGSPKVLAETLENLEEAGHEIILFTGSKSSHGFLTGLKNINYKYFGYKRSSNKLLTLFSLITSQIRLFFQLLKYRSENITIYVNTVLPFGAALAGKLMGKRVVYHMHETSVSPQILKSFLFGIANWTSSDSIFVSDFLRKEETLKKGNQVTIPNSLSQNFLDSIPKSEIADPKIEKGTIFMACSLKKYKGVNEFVEIAKSLPQYSFELVLNSTIAEINEFFEKSELPSNLKFFPAQTSLHSFYQRSKLVLNLSKPDEWVETFGLTVLEGISYGRPVICPPVGGCVEIIDHKVNGYQIDSRNTQKVSSTIEELFENDELYCRLSNAALQKAKTFSPLKRADTICNLFDSTQLIPIAENFPKIENRAVLETN